MTTKPIKYQNIHKIAELLVGEPNLSHQEIAERIGSTVNSVKQNRTHLNNANEDPVAAILLRNQASLRAHHKRQAAAQNDPNYRKPLVEIEGRTMIHKIAKLDPAISGMNNRQVAKLIGSTASSVKHYRQWLKEANGDPEKAAQLHSEDGSRISAQRTKDAAKWRAQQEWQASGIPD